MSKKFKNIFVLIVVVIVATFFVLVIENKFFSNILNKNTDLYNTKHLKIAGQTLEVKLATNPYEREQGLSGRISIKENEGMLFVFPTPGKYNFWMKEMNFPIDIIWLDRDFHIIYIKKNIPPSSYPESFGPEKDSMYVLEVLAGFSEKNNLHLGDFVEFLP